MANNVFFEINGERYFGFQNVVVEKSLLNLSSSFTATLVSKETVDETRTNLNPIKIKDSVAIYIDDDLVLTGFVEVLNVVYDASSHIIEIAGRDKACDLIDSSATPNSYNNITTITKLIEKALKDNGFSDLKVSKSPSSLDDSLEDGEKIQVELGETIFGFLDRYAKKAQVLITTDNEGNLLITREGSETANSDLISLKGNAKNNIFSANMSLNTSDRFNEISIFANDTNTSFDKTTVNQNAVAYDADIRETRKIIILPQETSQAKILKQSAQWQVNVRRAKGITYQCTVVNFRDENEEGNLWQVNSLVNVIDDKCGLDSQFLISAVSFSKSLEGSFTAIKLVNKGCFSNDPLSLVQDEIGTGF